MIATRMFVIAGVLAALTGEVKVPEHFFDAPVGPFACRPLPATAADSAASILEFLGGETDPRETLAAFDSVGVPLYMTVQSTENPPGAFVSHNVLVRFTFGGKYLRVEMPVKNGELAYEAGKFDNIELTSEEVAESKQLAIWFWERRCNR